MKTIKVSVCVSVHNTAELLPRCLDSLVNQTMKEIEIVLVNNGSTDDSEKIMYNYKERFPDKNIKVIAQEDKGLAQGRQTGINNSEGEYIAFLDADDYFEIDAVQKMYNAAINNNADIVEIESIRDGSIISSNYYGMLDAEIVLKDYLANGNIPTMLWLRLYKRELFTPSVLPNLYTNNEDNFAIPCLLLKGKSIFFIKEVLHYYSSDNENAVMNVLEKNKVSEKYIKNRKMTLQIINHVEDYYGDMAKVYEKELNKFFSRIVINYLMFDSSSYDYDKRIDDIICNTKFTSERNVELFIKNNYVRRSLFSLLIRFLGLKKGVYYYKKIASLRRAS